MAKFKVGDIIKANKESNERYGVTTQKNGWTGKVLSIEAGLICAETITPTCDRGVVYPVMEDFFDLADDNQIQRHIVNKNAVVIILNDGRKGVAKCSPDDKFNIAFGTALAVARAYGDKETEVKLLAEPAAPVKEEPKFKVGELVRIRQWDDMAKELGTVGTRIPCLANFVKEMKPLCGKYAEIVRLKNNSRVELKFFNCDGLYTGWMYSTDMLEKV
nr:MAG TPA: Mind bomb SH3 repeat domain [Caudoviricetes sp.]